MSIIDKFGTLVGQKALTDPEKARQLLLTGYHLQAQRLRFFPDKSLPSSGQYVARVVMQNMIQALSHPENAAMVSIFVPGELLTAAGLTPYSVEALSCFLAGTRCEQPFLHQTEEEGFPETMCSYHRVFLGSALTGLVPRPKCMIYTNLACDGNMMTFPYLKQKEQLPGFYIDVPYEKNEDSVKYVAGQLRQLKAFLEEITGHSISEQAVAQAVENSRKAAANYKQQLLLRKEHDPVTTLTNELYAIFMCHLLAGSESAVKYTQLLLDDVRKAPKGEGLHLLWMHIMPFLQEPVKEVFNYSQNVHISACDFVADGFREMQASDPYEALAEKMVYCIYNGSIEQRIQLSRELAETTQADGGILFAHWGCKNTIGASSLIKSALETSGLPTLILDGDGCNPANTSDGQVSTRLQAYLEMLQELKQEKQQPNERGQALMPENLKKGQAPSTGNVHKGQAPIPENLEKGQTPSAENTGKEDSRP